VDRPELFSWQVVFQGFLARDDAWDTPILPFARLQKHTYAYNLLIFSWNLTTCHHKTSSTGSGPKNFQDFLIRVPLRRDSNFSVLQHLTQFVLAHDLGPVSRGQLPPTNAKTPSIPETFEACHPDLSSNDIRATPFFVSLFTTCGWCIEVCGSQNTIKGIFIL